MEVNKFSSDRPSLTIRQDRVECDPERHSIQTKEGRAGSVVNYSPFGFAMETTSKPAEYLEEITICVDDYPVSLINAQKVRESQRDGKFVSGYAVQGAPIDVEALAAIKKLNEALSNHDSKISKSQNINAEFKNLTLAFKDVLLELEQTINGLELDTFQNNLSTVQHFEDRIADRVARYLSARFSPGYARMGDVLRTIPAEAIPEHYEYFRTSVGQIMYKSAYAHRAFFKPKGYAGDYEMMNNVYHRELRGESLFAKCLQRYFVDEPAGKAVRNREVYVRGKILATLERAQGRKVRILSVASGPAFEVQNLVRTKNLDLRNVEYYLLDQDLDALKYAQRKITEASRSANTPIDLRLLNLNIKQVIQSGLPEHDFDLIYSAGLFDYFTDPVAVYAATQLMKSTKADGRVIIGNFSNDNPNQLAMSLIMDWDLICRSEADLKQLYGSLGHCDIESEEQGINLFAVLNK